MVMDHLSALARGSASLEQAFRWHDAQPAALEATALRLAAGIRRDLLHPSLQIRFRAATLSGSAPRALR